MPEIDPDAKVDELARELAKQAQTQIAESEDGHYSVSLQVPARIGEISRRTVGVRPVLVGDVRAMGGVAGDIDVLAARIVEPKGAYDALASNTDMLAVQIAAGRQLGKFIAGGSDSPSSSPAG